ncbi:MAG TPA: hypothetical protein VFD37_04280, partial [Solirubrobacterales bacterium]|nr:hypothetical protein [Solirubrobacterales bacterium]
VERAAIALARLAGPRLRAAVGFCERRLTGERVVIAIAVVATAALIASQFLDYRGVAIGGPQYSEVSAITTAPVAATQTPWDAHGPLIGLAGLIALGALLLSLLGRGVVMRRARLVAIAAAAVALVATLVIDLPRATDLGTFADRYAGAEAILLEAFYIQLSAAAALLYAALLPVFWAIRSPRSGGATRSERRRAASPRGPGPEIAPTGPGREARKAT